MKAVAALSVAHPGVPELHDCEVSEHGSNVDWPLPVAAQPAGVPPMQVTSLLFCMFEAPFGQQKVPLPLEIDEPTAHAASPSLHAA